MITAQEAKDMMPPIKEFSSPIEEDLNRIEVAIKQKALENKSELEWTTSPTLLQDIKYILENKGFTFNITGKPNKYVWDILIKW